MDDFKLDDKTERYCYGGVDDKKELLHSKR